MSGNSSPEPIAPDELIYRRIPANPTLRWYDSGVSTKPVPEAFRPTRRDTTGLSFTRARFTTIERAAQGTGRFGYYVAVLRAGDLECARIPLQPTPQPDNRGHCEIPGLTFDNRDQNFAIEWAKLLAQQFCLAVHGPFNIPTGE